MARMPIPLQPEPNPDRPPLKPFLLLTLTIAVLAFCGVLLSR